MATLGLEITGTTQFKADVRAIIGHVQNFKPMAKPIDWVLRKSVERHFRGEGTHKGAWATLALSTQLQRARMGFPSAHPILVRTGFLKKSLISRGHSKHILAATRRFIDFGSKVKFAAYHQTGTRKMPARPPIMADANDLNQIIRFMRMYVMDNQIFRG